MHASKRVFRWLRHGLSTLVCYDNKLQERAIFQQSCTASLVASNSNLIKQQALESLVAGLLLKGVVEGVAYVTPCPYNIVFWRPKPSGSWRLIFHVSVLNKFLLTKTFKMDSAQVDCSGMFACKLTFARSWLFKFRARYRYIYCQLVSALSRRSSLKSV